MARLKVKYTEEVAPALFKKFGYKSTMQIPKIDKVVVNVGCGEARENAKVLDAVVNDRFIVVPGMAMFPSLECMDAVELIAAGLHPDEAA